MPIQRKLGKEILNTYSDADSITNMFSVPYILNDEYDIKFVPCISKYKDRNFFVADHKFLSPTYRGQWTKKIDDLNEEFGFYKGDNREQYR